MGEQEELVGVELFGPGAVEPSQELFELMLEVLVQDGLLAQRFQKLADELMGGFQIGGE